MNTPLRVLASDQAGVVHIKQEGLNLGPATAARQFIGFDPLSADGAPIFDPELIAEECYEFAGFRLLPKRRALVRGADRIAIGGRALDLLCLLVARAGDVVGFADLMRLVWPNVTVEEANVRVQINILRKILSQWEEANCAINTVPNRGYCFVLPVRHHPGGEGSTGSRAQPSPTLPILAGKIVGRDDAIRIIEDALEESRLVTITGPGGIGKTTVAIATVKRYAENFRGLVRFIDLSNVNDGSAAIRVIAEALHPMTERDFMDGLCARVGADDALLVLDTCEHIVEDIAMLAETLLGRCPGLRLLVTSRETLRAAGEWIHSLPSLMFPGEGQEIDERHLNNFSAVSLFIERVRSTTRFQPCRRDLPKIAEICRRLDGIPLALELAAARVAELGLREIASRLDNRFTILTKGRRTALPRHRTLAAAFDWSYGLLSDQEQRMLVHLAALRGSFTAERAIASCGGSAGQLPAEVFYSLLDKSFLAVERAGDAPMFRLLETTRAYAANVARSL
ncbi:MULTISPECIES: ATP-binding protein [unclassified Bradyrhizobium]|uniref:ATP-binding protein n=1 Tax=Bradyrhizobium TaxID=374 RepID=UPI0028E36438|nr:MULTISPECIES: winged helix-turn-helix domain-containing protein [unclassified Bradyrhizobium]